MLLATCRSTRALLHTARRLHQLSKDQANDGAFASEQLPQLLLSCIGRAMRSLPAAAARSSCDGQDQDQQQHQQQGSIMHLGEEQRALQDDTLLLFTGCLKNISCSPAIQQQLLNRPRQGNGSSSSSSSSSGPSSCMALMLQLLQLLAALAPQQDAGGPERGAAAAPGLTAAQEAALQVSVQAVAVLRNMAPQGSLQQQLAASAGCLPVLLQAAAAWGHHQELALNWARLLSRLSIQQAWLLQLEQQPGLVQQVVRLLLLHRGRPPVLLRLAFALGQLTTSRAAARRTVLAAAPLQHIAQLLAQYAAGSSSSGGSGGGSSGGSSGGVEACTTKLLRLVANLALEPAAGRQLAADPALAAGLAAVLQAHSLAGQEELLLNCACALTNCAYYLPELPAQGGCGGGGCSGGCGSCAAGPPGLGQLDAARLCARLVPLLASDNAEVASEAARALGNLALHAPARARLAASRAAEALVLLLGHSDPLVLHAVCGAMTNLVAEPRACAALLASGGFEGLVELLALAAAQLAAGAGQAGAGGEGGWVEVAAAACAAAHNVLAAGDCAGEGVGVGAAAARACLEAVQQLQDLAPSGGAAGLRGVAARLGLAALAVLPACACGET
jgi:hypothetical protein